MPDDHETPDPTPPAPPPNPIVMTTPIHDQLADRLGVRQKDRRSD